MKGKKEEKKKRDGIWFCPWNWLNHSRLEVEDKLQPMKISFFKLLRKKKKYANEVRKIKWNSEGSFVFLVYIFCALCQKKKKESKREKKWKKFSSFYLFLWMIILHVNLAKITPRCIYLMSMVILSDKVSGYIYTMTMY